MDGPPEEDHTVVDFVVPPAGAPNGEKVAFAGYEGDPVEVLVGWCASCARLTREL